MTARPAVDPVCRTPLQRWNEALDRRHGGLVYHFCSRRCSSRFSATPERFNGSGPPPAVRSERERAVLPIFGLGCGGSGSFAVERQLRRMPGVLRTYVNPATEAAYVDYHSGLVTRDDLIDAIESVGYRSLRERRRRHSEGTEAR